MGSEHGFWTLLSQDERDVLFRIGLRRDYPRRETICHEGDPANHVYILLAGWVKIFSVTRDGNEIVRALRGEGDLVGESGGETTGRRNATIQAIDKVQALVVPYDMFNPFLDAHQGAVRAYRRVVAQKFNDTDTMLRRRAETTSAQRVAALLLDLSERHGRVVNGAIYLATPLSQQELASLAGTSRAGVQRAFTNWKKRGLIRTGQRHITILDQVVLGRIAGQHR